MSKHHAAFLLCLAGMLACQKERELAPADVVYEGDIAELLRARCARCHGADDAREHYRVDSYASVLSCPDTSPALRAIDDGPDGPALLAALERSDHAQILDASERARLERWLQTGAGLRHSAVHSAQILSSRSPQWHGKLASVDRYGPLLRAEHAAACGRCHAGAPVRPAEVKHAAPNATACTACHDQPEGVLACGTCHGDGRARAYPPRDPCLFGAKTPDAHRAHLESGRSTARELACTTCHPAADGGLSGQHANGVVDVVFDAELAGPDARYDASAGQCSVACHTRGGALEKPTFRDPGPLTCNDCHRSPPERHYGGACSQCHPGVNASGNELSDTRLHLNGRVDLGDASGTCSACHGKDGDPMPRTASHLLHRNTLLTRPIACNECHVVPEDVNSAGHLDQGDVTPADVTFGPRARAREQEPSYDERGCRQVACHGSGLPERIERALAWEAPASAQCGGCHGTPPKLDHPAAGSCAAAQCHGSEVTLAGEPPAITELGRAQHIDGEIDVKQP